MNESEWLASGEPGRMFNYLMWAHPSRGPIRRRDLELFVEACSALGYCCLPGPMRTAEHMAVCVGDEPSANLKPAVAALLRDIFGNPWRPPPPRPGRLPGGLPLRRGRTALRALVDPPVLSIAQAAYDGRDWAALPVLADALEDAGCPQEVECWCENAEAFAPRGPGGQMATGRCRECRNTGRKPHPILAHLRGHAWEYNDGGTAYWRTDTSGPQLTPGLARAAHAHARGCWALGLILGRE